MSEEEKKTERKQKEKKRKQASNQPNEQTNMEKKKKKTEKKERKKNVHILFICEGNIFFPLTSHGSNGLPVATTALPSVHSYAC